MNLKNANNKKELKNSKLQKNCFEVPENYFENFEDIVVAKLKAEVLYKNETSEIPEDYFNTIETDVLQKIKPRRKVISLRSKVLKIATPIAVAASILFAVVLTNDSNLVTFDSLTNTDVENWLETEMLTDTEIATIFNENELSEIYLEPNISEDEFLDYLNPNELENLIYEN